MVAGLSHHPRIHLPIIAFPSSRTKKGPKMRKIILPLAALLLLVYDGYYDGYYGGFNDGYWGNDGFFWYSGRDQVWHRDEDRHFRREGGSGFNPVHGHRGGDRDH
jgi:hypothetical protein